MKSILIVIFLTVNYGLAQELTNESLKIIPAIMGQDTIIKDHVKKSLAYRVSSGKMSKQDSISYLNTIKNSRLVLLARAQNDLAKEYLAKEWLRKTNISKYLTDIDISDISKKIPSNSSFNRSQIDPIIDIIDEKCKGNCHSFSFPFLIKDNRYLIFHTKQYDSSVSRIEFIVYDIDKSGKSIIADNISIWNH